MKWVICNKMTLQLENSQKKSRSLLFQYEINQKFSVIHKEFKAHVKIIIVSYDDEIKTDESL